MEIVRSHHHCHYIKIEFVSHERLMTLTLNLPPELEQYLLQEANKQGLSVHIELGRACDGCCIEKLCLGQPPQQAP